MKCSFLRKLMRTLMVCLLASFFGIAASSATAGESNAPQQEKKVVEEKRTGRSSCAVVCSDGSYCNASCKGDDKAYCDCDNEYMPYAQCGCEQAK